jgi:hypothetical protein
VLARLAVAFSPPHRALRLRDVESVRVLRLDPSRGIMDLQAVVCEDDGCVTLRVPVAFPEPCPVDDYVEHTQEEAEDGGGGHGGVGGGIGCVRDNLDRLDAEAVRVLGTLERGEDRREEEAARERTRRALLLGEDRPAGGGGAGGQQHQPPQYPEWWVRPHEAAGGRAQAEALAAECDSVRRLLNDPEFGSAVGATRPRRSRCEK